MTDTSTSRAAAAGRAMILPLAHGRGRGAGVPDFLHGGRSAGGARRPAGLRPIQPGARRALGRCRGAGPAASPTSTYCRSRIPSTSRATRCRPACGRSTRKLGVTSRSEALERAVDLRLPSAGGNHPRLGDASPDRSASIGIGSGRRLAMKDRDRAGRQCAAAARYAPRADSGPAAFRPTWLSMLPSVLRQSVSVLGQEGLMVCFCGPAGHRGNAARDGKVAAYARCRVPAKVLLWPPDSGT
jgi:hypothetical protein